MNTSRQILGKYGIGSLWSATSPNVMTCRFMSSRSEIIKRQNDIFNMERKLQKESVGRIEKIDVNYVGKPENVSLIMNKDISTPFDCARHIGETIMKRSVVALINNESLWHMHRPLPDSCNLDFLHFTVQQPASVNKVFWRTCSFLLGATLNTVFKDNIKIHLHSFPSPNVKSGSFVYDVELGLDSWNPTQDEMRVLSIEMLKICHRNLPLEYLMVSEEVAQEMFRDNPNKSAQIPDIAVHNDQKVTLYRVGGHIDISKGPMLSNTSQVGRCTVTAVHKLPLCTESGANLFRFQGVALPQQIFLNHFAYGIIEERARKLNNTRFPGQESLVEEQPTVMRIS